MGNAEEELTLLYKEVYDLLEDNGKLEIPTEPYKYKYEAREKLEVIKTMISGELDGRQTRSNYMEGISELNAKLAAVFLHLGTIGLETEEYSTGQENFEKVFEIIGGFEMSSSCISLAVLCYNNLAVLWSYRDEQEKSHQYLGQAKDLYLKYRSQGEAQPPKSIHQIFLTDASIPGGWVVLEKLHTLTLFFLAQVMGKLGKSHESAHFCLSTLHRQLSEVDYQPLSWAVNSATLAKFYQDKGKYRLARRLLAAAWTMLQLPVASEVSYNPSEDREEKQAEGNAEVSKRWGIYCVNLLEDSYESCIDETVQEISNEEGISEIEELSISNEEGISETEELSEEECLEQMEFCQLELSNVEEQVGWNKVKNFDEAKPIFMAGLRWLNDAQGYYTLENHASVYTEIVQSISSLYKYLAHFDPSPDRQSKMHKRRVDILTNVLEELNPQYYLQVCRQLDFELGETYSAMVDCKYESGGNAAPNPQQMIKINHLAKTSIKHFENYLKSFLNASGEKPKKYPEDSERPVLVAYFRLGRLWSKIISSTREEKIQDVTKSLESYKALVDYCDLHPESASLMELELPASREIVQLLPYKIERIRNQI